MPDDLKTPIVEPTPNYIKSYFEKMELDPESVQSTLGRPHTHATADAILDATSKVLKLSRREVDPDDRDSLEFQTVHDASDFLPDKVRMDQGGILRKALWKLTNKNGDFSKVPAGLLDKHNDNLFNVSGLSQGIEETSNFEMYDQNTRVHRMGEGALPSIDAIPLEARAVSPSYLGLIDCVRTPESLKVGVDLKFARNVKKGPNNLVYTKMLDKDGKEVWVSSRDLPRSIVMFPDSGDKNDKFVPAIVRGRTLEYVDRKTVNYTLPSGDDMFSEGGNLTPSVSGVKGMRLLLAGKYPAAALSITGREAPLVQTMSSDGTPTSDRIGKHLGPSYSSIEGTVTKVTPTEIWIKDAKGKIEKKDLYNDHPYMRKSYLHNTPEVEVGQMVKAGDILASSNFTDSKGNAALGANVRMAYMPHDGLTFEDSSIISESLAKRMTSLHMYNEDIDTDDATRLDKKTFMQMFPGKYSKEQLAKLDAKGMVLPGVVLNSGDPMFLGIKETPPGPGNMGRGSVRQVVKNWEYDTPGTVAYAAKTKGGFTAFVKTQEPFQEGGKIATPYGSKSVVARIYPDDQMPRDNQGRPVEWIMSPFGVQSRTNPALIPAGALGKIAAKTGIPYNLRGFNPGEVKKFADEELAKHNMTDKEDVYDPVRKVTIPGIYVGNVYAYKMQQTAENKGHARSVGTYSAEDVPLKGGSSGSKHVGDMEWFGLLSHNAIANIYDMKQVKGRRNDDYWRQVKLGQTPSVPGTPVVYSKFKDLLKAAGVNLSEGKDTTSIFGMTNAQAEKLTGNRELDSASTFNANTFKPIPGGLFDSDKTGSLGDGRGWSYYSLPEPLPNPVMEEPIRALLGVTKKDFDKVISGELPLNGKYGGQAITEYLKRVNLDDVMNTASETIRSGSKSKRDAAVKVYGYASAMKKQGVRPEEFMMTRVPVLPPAWRPITASGARTMVADQNYTYRALFDSIQDYKDSMSLPEDLRQTARQNMYNSYRSLVGTTDPTQEKLVQKNVGGLLDSLLGKSSPKLGFFQRRVIGSNIDMGGLGVVTLNSSLKLNEIGLPEATVWDLYSPFIVRKLVQQGMPAMQAAEAIKSKTEQAGKALQGIMKERPVLMNRAPTNHKYSIMAVWPRMTKGHSVQVNPTLMGPYTMDLDGDVASYSVPVSNNAVKEAIARMLPEKNLLSVSNDKPMYVPSQEFAMGGWTMSKEPNRDKPVRFNTWQDAVKAYKTGQIKVDTPVIVGR